VAQRGTFRTKRDLRLLFVEEKSAITRLQATKEGACMRAYKRFLSGAVLLTAAFLLLMTGCHPAMSIQFDPTSQPQISPNKFPLKFVDHDFEPHCYNTLACTVIYNDYDYDLLDAHTPSGPPRSLGYKDRWWPASHGGIRNFPCPAEVHWTSLDGVIHAARVDIGAIFRNERVLYKVPDSEIRDGIFPQGLVAGPSIFLEVNNRTINVYMAAMIPTKREQTPGNKDSDYRADVLLAWTHNY
jgi:hypothetical protein